MENKEYHRALCRAFNFMVNYVRDIGTKSEYNNAMEDIESPEIMELDADKLVERDIANLRKNSKELCDIVVNLILENIDFNNASMEELLTIGFSVWSNDHDDMRNGYPLLLFPSYFMNRIPFGTQVTSIDGDDFEIDEHFCDWDIRMGCFSFGVYPIKD